MANNKQQPTTKQKSTEPIKKESVNQKMTSELYNQLRDKGYTKEQIKSAWSDTKTPKMTNELYNSLRDKGYTKEQIKAGQYSRENLMPWLTSKDASKTFSSWSKSANDFSTWSNSQPKDWAKWDPAQANKWADILTKNAQQANSILADLKKQGAKAGIEEYDAYQSYADYFTKAAQQLRNNNSSYNSYRDANMYKASDGNYYTYDDVLKMEESLSNEISGMKRFVWQPYETSGELGLKLNDNFSREEKQKKKDELRSMKDWIAGQDELKAQNAANADELAWVTKYLGNGQNSEAVYQQFADKAAQADKAYRDSFNFAPSRENYRYETDEFGGYAYDDDAYNAAYNEWTAQRDELLRQKEAAEAERVRAEKYRDMSLISTANSGTVDVASVIEKGKAAYEGLLTGYDEYVDSHKSAPGENAFGGNFEAGANEYRENAAKRRLADTDTWSEDKLNAYYYLLGSGKEADAERLAKLTNEAIEAQKNYENIYKPLEDLQYGWKKDENGEYVLDKYGNRIMDDSASAKAGRFFGGAAAFAAGTVVPLFTGIPEYLATVYEYSATGEINPNSVTPIKISNQMVGNTAGMLNQRYDTFDNDLAVIGGKGWGDAYQIAISIAQSALSIATGNALAGAAGLTGEAAAKVAQAVTLTQFFGSAASSGIYDALDRGLDPGKAIALGTMNGIAEVLGETLSVENLIKIGNSQQARKLLLDVFKQAGIEASEEAFTTVLNTMADMIVNGDKAELQITINSYVSQGMSYEEAQKMAVKEWINGMAQDALSGAISGGFSAGAQTIRANVGTYHGQTEYLMDLAQQTAEGSKSREMLEGIQDEYARKSQRKQSGLEEFLGIDRRNISKFHGNQFAAQVSEDLKANNTETAVKAIENKLAQLGETGDLHQKAQVMADALIREMSGEEAGGWKLTPSDQFSANATKNMRDVMNQLTDARKQVQKNGVNYAKPNEEWTDEIMKGRFLDEKVLSGNGKATAKYMRGRMAENSLNFHSEQIADLDQQILEAKKELGRLSPKDNAKRTELNNRIREAEKTIKSHQDAILNDGKTSYTEAEKNATVQIDGKEYRVSGLTMENDEAQVKLAGPDNSTMTVSIDDDRLPGALRSLAVKVKSLGWAANMAFERYQPGTDIADYVNRIQNLRAIAAERINRDAFMNNRAVQALNDPVLAEYLYSHGQTMAEDIEKRAKAFTEKAKEIEKAAKKKSGRDDFRTKDSGNVDTRSGWTFKDGTHAEGISGKKLSDKQNRMVKFVTGLAETFNLDYVIFDGDESGTLGVYRKGGTIGININAGNMGDVKRMLCAETLSHEMTHWMEDFAPEEYAALREAVVNAMFNKNAAAFERLVQKAMRELDSNGRSETELRDAAVREVVADACTIMLKDSKAVTDLARENMTLAEKVKDFIDQTVKRIRKALADVYSDSDPKIYRDEAKLIKGEMSRLQKLYDEGIKTALHRYNAFETMGVKSTDVWNEVNEKAASEGGEQYMAVDENGNVIVDEDVNPQSVYSTLQALETGSIKDTNFTFPILKHTPQVYLDYCDFADRSFVMHAKKAKEAMQSESKKKTRKGHDKSHKHALGSKGLMHVITNLHQPENIILQTKGSNAGHYASVFTDENGDIVAAVDIGNYRFGSGTVNGEKGFYNVLLTAYDDLLPSMREEYDTFDEYVTDLYDEEKGNVVVYDRSKNGEYKAPKGAYLSESRLEQPSGASSDVSITDTAAESNTQDEQEQKAIPNQISLDDWTNGEYSNSNMHPKIRARIEAAAETEQKIRDFFHTLSQDNENWFSDEEIDDLMDYDVYTNSMYAAGDIIQNLSDIASEATKGKTKIYELMESLMPYISVSEQSNWIYQGESKDDAFAKWYTDKHPSLYYPGYRAGDLSRGHLTGENKENVAKEIKYLRELLQGNKLNESERAEAQRLLDGLEAGEVQYQVAQIVGDSGKKYGTGVILDSTLLDNLTDTERIQMVKLYIESIGGQSFTAYDSNGNPVDVKVEEKGKKFRNKHGKRIPVNKDLTDKFNQNKIKQESIVLLDELLSVATEGKPVASNYTHGWLDNNGLNPWDKWTVIVQDKSRAVWKATLQIANANTGDKILYDIHPIKKVEGATKLAAPSTGNSKPQNNNPVNTQSQQTQRARNNTDTEFEAEYWEKAWNDMRAEKAILEETAERLTKEIAKLTKQNEKLGRELSRTVTPETRLNDAKKLAREIISQTQREAITTKDKAYNREMVNELAERIKAVADYIVQEGEKADYDHIAEMAYDIASDIVNNAEAEIDDGGATKEMREQMRAALKGRAIFVPENVRADVLDWNAFKKQYKGIFTFKDNGLDIDIVYENLLKEVPGLLDPNINNPGDMLNELAEKWDLLQPKYENPFEGHENEVISYYMNEIVQSALDGVLRQVAPTYADRMNDRIARLREEKREAVKSAKQEAREKLSELRAEKNAHFEEMRKLGIAQKQEALAKERADKWERVEATRQYYQEMANRAAIRRSNTANRARIRTLVNDLNARLTHPTEKKYVPAHLVKNTIDILEMIDMDTGRGNVKLQEKIALLQQQYAALKADESFNGYAYDPIIEDGIANMARAIGDTPLRNMSSTQLETVLSTLKSIEHTIRTAVSDKLYDEEWNFFESAKAASKATNGVSATSANALGKAADWYTINTMRPDVVFDRFGGFAKGNEWERIAEMLNKAQRYGMDLQMMFAKPFEELLSDKKSLAKLTSTKEGDMVDIGLKDENGEAIRITRDFMLFVYMNLMSEDNIKHIMYGGITVPEIKEYLSGKGDRGYGKGARQAVGISQKLAEINNAISNETDATEKARLLEEKDSILQEGMEYIDRLRSSIEEQLTDYDRKWVKAWGEFNEMATKVLNDTTMQVYGIKKFIVENYFPIITDRNFLNVPMETIIKDMSLENAGFTKERIHASNPIKMMGLADVINMQASRTAQYAAIMPATRAFSKIYSKTMPGYSTSVKKALNSKFGGEAIKFVENLMADLQGGRRSDFTIFDRMRGRMAQATLSLNPRVALAQTASFPTAAAELGWRPVMKALRKGGKDNRFISAAERELIAKWSSALWYRNKGGTVELGDIKNMQQAQHKVMDKMGWAMNWISFMDSATVGRLWYAAQYYVDEKNPELQKGSDAYYEKVAEAFNRCVERTQPNYTTMQRPELLRNPHAAYRMLFMFMTQRLQNQSILYGATAKYLKYKSDLASGKNGVTQADVNEMRSRFVNAATSQVVAAMSIALFKALCDGLLHRWGKKYRDDDEKLTAGSVSLEILDMFAESLVSNVVGGSEIYSAVKSIVTGEKYYGVEMSGFSTFNDAVKDFVSLAQQPSLKSAKKLAESLCTFLGIPAANAEKIGLALWYWGEDMIKGEFMEAGVERTSAQNARLLTMAYAEGDEKKIEKYSAEFKDDDAKLDAVRQNIKDGYVAKKQTISKTEAVELLVKAGMRKKDAEAKVQEWTCEIVTGIPFSKIKDEYMAGNITQFRVAELLQTYGGRTKENAEKTARSYACEKDTGHPYNDLKEAYLEGEITRAQLTSALKKYGAMNGTESENKATYYDYLKSMPDSKISEQRAVTFMKSIKQTGVTAKAYEDMVLNVDADDSGGYSQKEVGRYIQTHNFTYAQINALWKAFGKTWKTDFYTWEVKMAADATGTGKGKNNGNVSQAELGYYLADQIKAGKMTVEQAEKYWSSLLTTSKKSFSQWAKSKRIKFK